MKGILMTAALLGTAARAEMGPLLIGGTPADPKDWPASVYASMSNARCSATVVGERVLLIAAHCVSDGGTATFQVGANAYRAGCTHHPSYRQNSTADWALCLVDRPVAGIEYELVAVGTDWCRVGQEARLTGYGCIRSGGGGGNDGIYRIGKAPITACPSGPRNFDTVTRGSSALCFGDSGGPAFIEFEDGTREVFGVNSRGDISTTSYLSTIGVESAQTWLKSWAQAKGVKVCGVHPEAERCRGVADPDPDPEPTPGCAAEVAAYELAKAAGEEKWAALKACVER